MFWADKIAKDIIASGKYEPYWVDDMFTPSGFAHTGSLRGPLVHDIVYRSLLDAGVKARYTYVFNDFDPIDGLPPELIKTCGQYLGFPLRTAPSPVRGYKSFAHYFSEDFQHVLKILGVHAEFLSSWDMYHEGKFNGVIREALDKAEVIQDIYQKVSGSKKREKNWLPLQVMCEKCGKLGTTRVHDWDGKTVAYTCEPHMVTWATGCGYSGRTDPFDGRGKLPWKVDWAAHWKVLGVTIEGAGKDHSSAGGSRDIGKEECQEVFGIENPYNIPYEFFLIGGRKMGSSKGLGLKARDFIKILPPEVGRFVFTRTDYRQAIEFNPVGTMAIPDLLDEYDRCFQAYIDGFDDVGRAFELSQIEKIPPKKPVFLPRFRDVANYIQLPNINLEEKCTEMKGSPLTQREKKILEERMKYARVWIDGYAPDDFRMQLVPSIPKEVKTLTIQQKEYLQHVIRLLETYSDPDELQKKLYETAKEVSIDPKEAFAGIYTVLLGKKFGPKAAWFLLQYPKEEIIQRLHQAISVKEEAKKEFYQKINNPDYFSIDKKIIETYPSVSVGIALIKDVHIAKINPQLEKEKQELVKDLEGLMTSQINTYKEVLSYRKIYKAMGIDWHSRRPSPEALLRRIATGKGLYTVNTCVDAYNLIVMKHRVSAGAFDANTIAFPTTLRFPEKGDEIILLGDKDPTIYTEKEFAYYDQKGGFNIDFNYRDAQRTMVTEKTKSLWINVDGIFDITPSMVQRTLDEVVAIIQKYCGGTVEFSGVVTS